MNNESSRKGWIVLLGVPALFFSAYVVGAWPPLKRLPLCAVKLFTGIDCPGCGLTRSIAYLTHGQVGRSIDMNPMGIVVALWLAYVLLRAAIGAFRGRQPAPLLRQKTRDRLFMVFVAALIGQWLVKMYFSLFTSHFSLYTAFP
jgi:hypothetical protein